MSFASTTPIRIFYVEPTHTSKDILDAIDKKTTNKDILVIVLPDKPLSLFQSPKDFHELKLRKRQSGCPIVFVIANTSLAQCARMNGFPVYSSLEALAHPDRPIQPAPSSSGITATQPAIHKPSSFSPTPSLSSAPSFASAPSFSGQLEDSSPSLSVPAIPLPIFAEDFSLTPAPEPPFPSSPIPAQTFTPAKISLPTHQRLARETLPPTEKPPQKKPSARQRQLPVFLVLLLIIICASIIAALLFTLKGPVFQPAPVSDTPVGALFFLSSGQSDLKSDAGNNDVLELSLSQLAAPAPGQSYYVWLRKDNNRSDSTILSLGRLNVSAQGTARLTYVDPQHTDLFAVMSRVLITEESTAVPPLLPSPDPATWRYEGSISQLPTPGDQNHFSLLDHLRHLLAAEPMLEKRGLHGGLTFWLARNSSKLLEWTRSAQDDWGNPVDTTPLRQQVARVLGYLDGISNVTADIPPGTAVLVDQAQASIGLLQTSDNQDPPAYVQDMGFHLRSLLTTPGTSARQRERATQVNTALNHVQQWLENARQDARKLIVLSDSQLLDRTALSLLDDMLTQVNNAYGGTIDPATGTELHGIAWIANTMHMLARIDIQPYQK